MNFQHYQNEFRILGFQCWLSRRRRRCPQGLALTSDCVAGGGEDGGGGGEGGGGGGGGGGGEGVHKR